MKNRIVRFPGVSPVPSPASNSSDVNSPILSESVAETPSSRPTLHGVRNWRILCALLLALVTAGLSSCHSASYYYYKFPAVHLRRPSHSTQQARPARHDRRHLQRRPRQPADRGRAARHPQQRREHHPLLHHLRLQLRSSQTPSSTSRPSSLATSIPAAMEASSSIDYSTEIVPQHRRQLPARPEHRRHPAHIHSFLRRRVLRRRA